MATKAFIISGSNGTFRFIVNLSTLVPQKYLLSRLRKLSQTKQIRLYLLKFLLSEKSWCKVSVSAGLNFMFQDFLPQCCEWLLRLWGHIWTSGITPEMTPVTLLCSGPALPSL